MNHTTAASEQSATDDLEGEELMFASFARKKELLTAFLAVIDANPVNSECLPQVKRIFSQHLSKVKAELIEHGECDEATLNQRIDCGVINFIQRFRTDRLRSLSYHPHNLLETHVVRCYKGVDLDECHD